MNEQTKRIEQRRAFASSLSDFAFLEEKQGNLQQASDKYAECLTVLRSLVQEQNAPKDRRTLFLRLLSAALVERNLGQLDRALVYLYENLEITRALDRELPSENSRRDLCISLDYVAAVEGEAGHPQVALERCAEGVEIMRTLIREYGARTDLQRLIVVLQRVGAYAGDCEQWNPARSNCQESLDLAHRLLREQESPEGRREVGRALSSLGKIKERSGSLEDALKDYTERLTILRSLVRDHNEADDKRTLASELNRVGVLLGESGDLNRSLDHLTENLDLARELNTDLFTPTTRRNLGMALANVAGLNEQMNVPQGASNKYAESANLLRALVRDYNAPEDRDTLATVLRRAGTHAMQNGRSDFGRQCLNESIEVSRTLDRDANVAMGDEGEQVGRTESLAPPRELELKSFMPEPPPEMALINNIGKGGFGEVWSARHAGDQPGNTEIVALKFCDSTKPRALERLHAEAKILNRIGEHSGIVKLIETHWDAPTPCLRYELAEHGDLRSYLERRTPHSAQLTVAAISSIMRQVIEPVAFAHRKGVVHRDLKPENILVFEMGGRPSFKVTDFGISAYVTELREHTRTRLQATQSEQGSATGSVPDQQDLHLMRTEKYCSPEQRDPTVFDYHTADDVYALGVIWYQLLENNLTCNPPTGTGWKDRLHRERNVPPSLTDVIEKCLESRQDRYQNCGELLEALERGPR